MKVVVRLIACGVVAALAACASARDTALRDPDIAWVRVAPAARYKAAGDVQLGDPVAVTVDFDGNVIVADVSPGRLVRFSVSKPTAVEFQRPTSRPAFYPTDVAIHGFFVYAVDETGRNVVRFDRDGAYRDVLLGFDNLDVGRRVSPYGLATDASGRIAVTDVENHQVWVFDTYLALLYSVGNYGTYEGQLDSPEGVAFARDGGLLVVDTGNRRVQRFSDGGNVLNTFPARADGPGNPLVRPRRVAQAKGDGRVYVADPGAGAVFVFDEDGFLMRTIAPEGAERFVPTDVFLSDDRLFVSDRGTWSVYVFEGV